MGFHHSWVCPCLANILPTSLHTSTNGTLPVSHNGPGQSYSHTSTFCLQVLSLGDKCLADSSQMHRLAALPALPHTPPYFVCMQVLSLEDNCLAEWREVHRLDALPALQRLHLSNNPLTDVRYDGSGASGSGSGSDPTLTSSLGGPAHSSTPADPGAPAGFAALHCLVLGRCGLAEWGCVDQIGRFPALTELRITGR